MANRYNFSYKTPGEKQSSSDLSSEAVVSRTVVISRQHEGRLSRCSMLCSWRGDHFSHRPVRRCCDSFDAWWMWSY